MKVKSQSEVAQPCPRLTNGKGSIFVLSPSLISLPPFNSLTVVKHSKDEEKEERTSEIKTGFLVPEKLKLVYVSKAILLKHQAHSILQHLSSCFKINDYQVVNHSGGFLSQTSKKAGGMGWGFPGGTNGKEPACQCKRFKRLEFNSWVRKIPWRRKWQPTPLFLPGESHGQRSLVGYSPWNHKESDRTEVTQHTCEKALELILQGGPKTDNRVFLPLSGTTWIQSGRMEKE